uniref:Uncharacterized protein n=1 Tax=Globisporangium ultimum (strain ATCC 200006 / CBS 805.95 / DAOM BR144) TaxID=431595 RepID=K3WYU8_GLOUD
MGEKRETTIVPVAYEPLHQQRWTNDTVRVVGVKFPPHTTCQWHQHFQFSVYACINDLIATEQVLNQPSRILTQPRGSVFCRDHTQDQLVHIATSHEEPVFVVLVELLKEKQLLVPHDAVPLHVARDVACVNDSLECRVYRILMSIVHEDDSKDDKLSLALSTGAVLVALHECVVLLQNHHARKEDDSNGDNDSPQPHERMHSFQPGDDVVLEPGHLVIQLVSQLNHVNCVELVLVEVF